MEMGRRLRREMLYYWDSFINNWTLFHCALTVGTEGLRVDVLERGVVSAGTWATAGMRKVCLGGRRAGTDDDGGDGRVCDDDGRGGV